MLRVVTADPSLVGAAEAATKFLSGTDFSSPEGKTKALLFRESLQEAGVSIRKIGFLLYQIQFSS